MNKQYFGNYLHKNSFIHKINPLIKLISLCFLMSLSIKSNLHSTTILFYIISILLIFLSKLTFKEYYYSIRTFRFLILFAFFIQLFFSTSGDFNIIPSKDNIYNSVNTTLSFILVISFSAIYTLTTTPADIAKSIFFFIKPLKKLGVNTKDIAISIIIAIRFIPLLFEEADRIVTAQKLRGIFNQKKTLKEKFTFYLKAESFIIPLFLRVIYYGNQISLTLNYRDNIDKIMILPKANFIDYMILLSIFIVGYLTYAL